jgi:hypothetical protein
MSQQMQLVDLKSRHQALEKAISEALNHPSADGLTIAELKRRKLQVKDQMEQLRQEGESLH